MNWTTYILHQKTFTMKHEKFNNEKCNISKSKNLTILSSFFQEFLFYINYLHQLLFLYFALALKNRFHSKITKIHINLERFFHVLFHSRTGTNWDCGPHTNWDNKDGKVDFFHTKLNFLSTQTYWISLYSEIFLMYL